MSPIFYKLDSVKELADGDEGFIQVLVQTFLEEIPEDLESMIDAVAKNEAEKAYQYAHKMKPNFQLFGIEVLDEIKTIESWSSNKITQDEAKPALDIVVKKANEGIKALRQDFNMPE